MLVKLVMLVVLLLTVGDVLPALAQLGGTQVSRVFVRTHTADESNAETNADIYLGYAGRELNVDTRSGDRGQNEVDLYRFGGPDPNVVNPTDNNPTVGPRLVLNDVLAESVYLRMRDTNTNHWIVVEVDVQFAAFNNQTLATYCFRGRAILGPETGFKLPLVHQAGTGPCS
jgi:hypothetical protein